MSRWHHGHSIGTGVLLALALSHTHMLWFLSAAFLGGLALGRGWGALAHLFRRWAHREPRPVIAGQWRRVR